MAACAYVGITCADFVAWSVSDPYYARDGALIRRKWRSLKPRHGGALMAALKARGIKVRRASGRLIDEVPLTEPSTDPRSEQLNLRRADARINSTISAIDSDPTERCLFWASCQCAEIVHECKLSPTQIAELIAANVSLTPLRKTLGKEGIRRTIANAFRHVEEKLLGETETATEETSNVKGSGGGGYHSRQHVEKPVKTGTGSRGTRPAGTAQIGIMWGRHATNRDNTDYRGERLHHDRSFQPVKFGNEVALNVGKGGCGTGRTIHATGSQGTHGQAAAGNPPPNRYRDPLNND